MQFVMVGIASRLLTLEQFGVWAALATITLAIGFTDLGTGKAATIKIAAAAGRQDHQEISKLVSSSFLFQVGVCVALAIILLPAAAFTAWEPWFRLTSNDPSVSPSAIAVLTLSLATAPFNTARAAVQGLQKGWLSPAWDLIGSVVGIVAGAAAGYLQAGLFWMTLAASTSAVVSRFCCATWLFSNLPPKASEADSRTIRSLWRQGRHLLLAQLSDLVFAQGTPWVASRGLGASVGGGFVAALRLASLPSVLMIGVANALIPAYSDAHTRGDREWVRKTLVQSTGGAAALCLAYSLFVASLSPALFRGWLGGGFPVPSPHVLNWLLGYVCVQALAAPVWAMLYGVGQARVPATLNVLTVSAWLVSGAWAASTWGVTGLAAALCLTPAAIYLFPLSIAAWRQLHGEL